MADPLIYQLLQRLESLLNAHADLSAAFVSVGRVEVLQEDEMPAVNIYLSDDVSLGENGALNLNFLDWNVGIIVELNVRVAHLADLDKAYLDLRAAVHNAIMVDGTLGTNYVSFSVAQGGNEPQLTGEPDLRVASYKTEWVFRIRTAVDDLTTVG